MDSDPSGSIMTQNRMTDYLSTSIERGGFPAERED